MRPSVWAEESSVSLNSSVSLFLVAVWFREVDSCFFFFWCGMIQAAWLQWQQLDRSWFIMIISHQQWEVRRWIDDHMFLPHIQSLTVQEHSIWLWYKMLFSLSIHCLVYKMSDYSGKKVSTAIGQIGTKSWFMVPSWWIRTTLVIFPLVSSSGTFLWFVLITIASICSIHSCPPQDSL